MRKRENERNEGEQNKRRKKGTRLRKVANMTNCGCWR